MILSGPSANADYSPGLTLMYLDCIGNTGSRLRESDRSFPGVPGVLSHIESVGCDLAISYRPGAGEPIIATAAVTATGVVELIRLIEILPPLLSIFISAG